MFFEWKHLNIRRLGMFFEWKHLNYTTPFKKKYWKSDRKHEKNNAGLSNWYQYQGFCMILVDMVKKEVDSKITIFTVIKCWNPCFPPGLWTLTPQPGRRQKFNHYSGGTAGRATCNPTCNALFPSLFLSCYVSVCAWMWMLERTLWRWIAVIEHAEKYFVCINERYQRFNCENLC